MVKFYSRGCPLCKALEMNLKKFQIEYELKDSEEDFQYLIEKDFKTMPVLQLEDGTLMKYREALEWVRNYGNN